MAIWARLLPRRARLSLKSTKSPSHLAKKRNESPVLTPAPPASPHLPVEVWRRVLLYVVRITGSLATDSADPFINTRTIYHHDEFSPEDRFTLLQLTTVCKSWGEVISELICEYVIINGKEDLGIVVKKFEESKKASKETNGLGVGRWTRRIDFRMHRRDTDLPCIQTTAMVIRLLRCTPNLEIYVNSNGRNTQPPGRTHPRVIEALITYCGASLKRVEWNLSECPSWADLAGLLRGAPNVELLSLITVYGQSIPLPDNTLITLKNMKCLSLGMPNNAPPYLPQSWDPLLTCLSFTPEQLPVLERLDVNPFPTEAFFTTHGSKLRILRTNSADILPYLPFALDLCPNLHSLVIPPNFDICISESHPSIERIGIFPVSEGSIEVPERMYEAHIIVPMEECLMLLEGMHLPKLKLVKVRNVGSLENVIDHPLMLQFWWRRWNIRGVKFEDKVGKSFEKVISGKPLPAFLKCCP